MASAGPLRAGKIRGFTGGGKSRPANRFWVAQRFTTCGKTRFTCQRPSAAKAGLILWNLAARLEAAPFQNGFQTAFFRKLFSAAITVLS